MKDTKLRLVGSYENGEEIATQRRNYHNFLGIDGRTYEGRSGGCREVDSKIPILPVFRISDKERYRMNHYAKLSFDGEDFVGDAGKISVVDEKVVKPVGTVKKKPLGKGYIPILEIGNDVLVRLNEEIIARAISGDYESYAVAGQEIDNRQRRGELGEWAGSTALKSWLWDNYYGNRGDRRSA